MKKILILAIIACVATASKPKEGTWVAIGDSITYLNEHPDETGNRVSRGYLSLVTEKLPHIRYINQGHNGWTSGGIAEKIEQLGILKADIYTVFLGTNDWWAGRPIGKMADYTGNTGNTTVFGSFRIIINKLSSLNANAKIILITPMQRGDFVYINDMHNNAYGSYKPKEGQSLEQFAEAIRAIGKREHFSVVDLYHTAGMGLKDMVKFKRLKDPATGAYKNFTYPDYIGIPFDPGSDEYPYPPAAAAITYDGLHPSDKGFRIIADKLVKLMRRL